jgi:cell division protein FtsB
MNISTARKISYAKRRNQAISITLERFTKPQFFYIILLLSVIALFVVFYVISINSLSLKGSEIKQTEKQLKQLTEDNQQLKIQLVQLQTSENLARISQNFTMKEIKNTDYAVFGKLPVARANVFNP